MLLATGFWPPDVPFEFEDLRTVQFLSEKANRHGR